MERVRPRFAAVQIALLLAIALADGALATGYFDNLTLVR